MDYALRKGFYFKEGEKIFILKIKRTALGNHKHLESIEAIWDEYQNSAADIECQL